ncbi:polysaccharide deacetylase family protein [Pseudomonas fluorescens]|uniref:polysaccharide deacetylase family protein n=1 Tax=Pseudomonas fluorescens TaxID=294 RepID=UPI0012420B0F|nr:hypothetical protein [Pseudomonas fluorescens]
MRGGVPVGISISGLWLLAHKPEFDWLVQQRKDKKINITWINHSYSHLYFSDLDFSENFLNWKDTRIEDEFLKVEQLLIKYGETPSVFVRMPGLVSNEKTVTQAQQLGLIPLGADAWLAKGQEPKNSSIVLVHANGNEPKGIEDGLQILDDWQWLDLKYALDLPKT